MNDEMALIFFEDRCKICKRFLHTQCADCIDNNAIGALRIQQENKKGCEICNHPAKWLAVFGKQYPYLYAREQFHSDKTIKAIVCPLCGKVLKTEED